MSATERTTSPWFSFTVERFLSGVRIDSFLAKHLRNYTTWRLQRMVSAGAAQVNHAPAEPFQRVFHGQLVGIRLLDPPDKLLAPEPGPCRILYEDPWLMVVDKTAGMTVHPVGRHQQRTLTQALQRHLDQQTTVRGLVRAGIVHRLDRMTSGLMIVTKEHRSHRFISLDVQAGRLVKSYLALVEGCVPFDERTIEMPIGQYPDGRTVLMSAKKDALHPRSAKTRVTVLQRRRHITVVKCRLYTGRNHQIRVHMAEIGHPVLGDEFYGSYGQIRRESAEQSAPQRHALHAAGLEFLHPVLRVSLRFTSSPPEDFYSLATDCH